MSKGEPRWSGKRAESVIEAEGIGVRKYEKELYALIMGLKAESKCSNNVRRAYRIYGREGKLKEKQMELEKRYGGVRKVGNKREVFEKWREWKRWKGYILKTKDRIRYRGEYKKMYLGWNGVESQLVDNGLKASRYIEKPADYDRKMYELVEVELIEKRVVR